MEKQTFTGIGCFAKPERLGQIFSKMMQAYTLGPFKENHLFGGSFSEETEGARLLQALVAGPAGGKGTGSLNPLNLAESQNITGFYLSLDNQNLNLSIFAKGTSSGPKIYTTRLDELTKLRRQRLN